MTLIQDDSEVMLKTRELCETLASQASFQTLLANMSAFTADEAAQQQYDEVAQLSEKLQHRQRSGGEISAAEIADFEGKRDQLLQNSVVRGFLDAQEQMQQVRQTVSMYVMKTFEVGRVPEKEDFKSCGHGCNCGG